MAIIESGNIVDYGFENGSDAADLNSSIWISSGAPQRREYDTLRASVGSKSAWIQGPTSASNAGVYESVSGGMVTNASEIRFWLYFDTTSDSRIIEDYSSGLSAADRCFYLQFDNTGGINVSTDRAGNPNGYTTATFTNVGTYTTGWTQFQIIYSFTGSNAQTYTLSKRANLGDAWTQLKAAVSEDYNIPMRGTNTITQNHGTMWRCFQNGQMWLDDLRYSTTAIAEGQAQVIEDGGNLVDFGFENGGDGVPFPTDVVWHGLGGPLVGEYDVGAKVGSFCGRIKGANGANGGYWESSSGGLVANGAEIRFWHKPVNHTTLFYLTDYANPGTATPAADRAFTLYWNNNGTLVAQTAKTSVPTGYITGDNVIDSVTPSGWTQYRMVLYFSGANAQTFTLSRRANIGDTWTVLKSAGAVNEYIPMYGANTITQNHGTLWRGNAAGGAEFWIDDLQYSSSGITESVGSAPAIVTQPTAQAGISGSSVTFTATFSGFPAPTYQWQRSTTAGGATYGNISGATSTSYTFIAQAGDNGYLYRCVATNAVGSVTTNSALLTLTDESAPSVPVGLVAVGGQGQVSLSWTANTEPDLAGYDLYRGGSKLNTVPIAGTTYTDTGRSDYTIYTYQIAAVDATNNTSALCTAVTATTNSRIPIAGHTLLDNGFESGTDGSTLASPLWTASGLPQHMEYDNFRAKVGSVSAWIQGAIAGTNAGVYESTSGAMSTNGAEVRFWVYLDTTNQSRLIEDYTAGLLTADRAYQIQFDTNGALNVFTDRSGVTGYTTAAFTAVGSYSDGWTQVRIVYNFSGTNAQTYTLSKRSSVADAWTPLKSATATDYFIPMRGTNTITQSHGTLLRGLGNAQMWIDEFVFADSGISDDITLPSTPIGLSATVGMGQVSLSWTANTEPDLAGYDLYRDGVKVNGAIITATSYVDTGRADSVTYSYQLASRDLGGNVSAQSSAVLAAMDGAALFTFAPPEAVYNDRFTLRWSIYSGTDFAAYDIYLRAPIPFPENWVPSGSSDRITSITDINTLSYIVSGLVSQTEYDVCVVVRRTDGSHAYARRVIDSALMSQVTGNITFLGGARHVNTTDVNETAMVMDCDIYNKPYLFSVIDGQVRSSLYATQSFFPQSEVVLDALGRFTRPIPRQYGYSTVVESRTGAWGFAGHFSRKIDGTIWDERTDQVADRYRIESAIARSTDKVTWSPPEFITDLGISSEYKLIAGAGRPIALSDGSGVLPLYISKEYTPSTARRVDSVLVRTADNGATFTLWGYIYNNTDEGEGPYDYIDFNGEPSVVKIGGTFPNEHLVATFRPNNSGHVMITQSLDSGRTFETEIFATTMGDEVTPHDFGSASPQMHYDGNHIYVIVGNRVYNPTYPYLRPETSGAYLFRMPHTYSETGGVPNRIADLNANWSNGLRLGGIAATSNFDICYYGDVISIDPNTLLCSYYECVGSPRSYEGFQPTIDDPGQTKPQTSMPYIGMRYIDKSTMSIMTLDKTVQVSDALISAVTGMNVVLSWYGSADIYRSSGPGVDITDFSVTLANNTGILTDNPGVGTWYYKAVINSSWTTEVCIDVTTAPFIPQITII
ncbi:hypothetical protein HGB25_00315 [Candidatus Saccharibacteria bacterium]|nr:hypothetical protein [Candidatus Saccharibacteria bacterium]